MTIILILGLGLLIIFFAGYTFVNLVEFVARVLCGVCKFFKIFYCECGALSG